MIHVVTPRALASNRGSPVISYKVPAREERQGTAWLGLIMARLSAAPELEKATANVIRSLVEQWGADENASPGSLEAKTSECVRALAEEWGAEENDGPVTLDTITRERKRLRLLENFKIGDRDERVVTEEEISKATVRLHEAVDKYRAGENTNTPPWFDGAIAIAIAPLRTSLEHARIALGRVERTLKEELTGLDFRIQNVTIFTNNQNSYARSGDSPIIMPLKMKDGFRGEAPIAAMNPPTQAERIDEAEEILTAGVLGPGATLPPSFPRVSNAGERLEPYQIGYLCRFYNETFNIAEEDDSYAQNLNLQRFLSGL
ncbi:hypothetical protein R1sor_009825 [Riccia sorocarpa]|uniref:Uncharacterized protein n=1 Tax=Riccia sorocarpa TaxID=122646 RepID=A0ABD3I2A9_9MARC